MRERIISYGAILFLAFWWNAQFGKLNQRIDELCDRQNALNLEVQQIARGK